MIEINNWTDYNNRDAKYQIQEQQHLQKACKKMALLQTWTLEYIIDQFGQFSSANLIFFEKDNIVGNFQEGAKEFGELLKITKSLKSLNLRVSPIFYWF